MHSGHKEHVFFQELMARNLDSIHHKQLMFIQGRTARQKDFRARLRRVAKRLNAIRRYARKTNQPFNSKNFDLAKMTQLSKRFDGLPLSMKDFIEELSPYLNYETFLQEEQMLQLRDKIRQEKFQMLQITKWLT